MKILNSIIFNPLLEYSFLIFIGLIFGFIGQKVGKRISNSDFAETNGWGIGALSSILFFGIILILLFVKFL